jgi:hypothetical protein
MKSFIRKWKFPIFWCATTAILYFIILFSSNEIAKWPPQITADGLALFVKVFSIPLYFFAAGIPIYGIILTVKRLDQSEKQYSLLMYSSYYRHLDDFINYLKQINEPDIRLICGDTSENPEILLRRWHSIWFGNEKEFTHRVIEATFKNLRISWKKCQMLGRLYQRMRR